MNYATVDVIVNGALEETSTFTDYALMDHYMVRVSVEAAGHGYHTEVYVVWHEHDMDVEDCSCVQYLTDHHPYAEYNAPEDAR